MTHLRRTSGAQDRGKPTEADVQLIRRKDVHETKDASLATLALNECAIPDRAHSERLNAILTREHELNMREARQRAEKAGDSRCADFH